MSHSPAPWSRGGSRSIIRDAQGNAVAMLFERVSLTREQIEANGDIIEQAPSLALKVSDLAHLVQHAGSDIAAARVEVKKLMQRACDDLEGSGGTDATLAQRLALSALWGAIDGSLSHTETMLRLGECCQPLPVTKLDDAGNVVPFRKFGLVRKPTGAA